MLCCGRVGNANTDRPALGQKRAGRSFMELGKRTARKRVAARKLAVVVGLMLAGAACGSAAAQDTLKVAVTQRGAWDAGIAELGRRGGIFKKHGLDLDILY